jgi:hypothetical protein
MAIGPDTIFSPSRRRRDKAKQDYRKVDAGFRLKILEIKGS